ncbi:transposase [Rhodococcus sp. NPDC057014]|uniref:transposase n=1 Tax=Rhodococcus sp. NPDC057014 TaxID=3346000 RepID=UPI003625ED30
MRGAHPESETTGLKNLPLHGSNQNLVGFAIVQLAYVLTARTQTSSLARAARPATGAERLRLRLRSIAGRTTPHVRRIQVQLAA